LGFLSIFPNIFCIEIYIFMSNRKRTKRLVVEEDCDDDIALSSDCESVSSGEGTVKIIATTMALL